MRINPSVLFTPLLFINLLNPAYACSPAPGAKPASIDSKAQNSSYVFDGTVTEITHTHVNVKVAQYFKGTGLSEVKIARENLGATSCADHFELNQRALFFAKGKAGEPLEAVYDGAFGSSREMNADNFSQITATSKCMATYDGGVLSTPCVLVKDLKKTYKVTLNPINATGELKFSVADAQEIDKVVAADCLATYKSGILSVPCISYREAKRVYSATLNSIPSDGGLNFSVSHADRVTNTLTKIEKDGFDNGKAGSLPANWAGGITGMGDAVWQLEEDSTAPSASLVLNQSGYGDFPWCVKKDSSLTDGFVEVKFKAISGAVDQAGGLIWRWKDADNYYVARANALEDNVSIYYMKDGERYTLSYEDLPSGMTVDKNVWRTLRVDFKGNRFIVSFEGVEIIDIKDNEFKGEGAVGVWTKEDSETSFDDFIYGQR